jgi:hypothetical protein
VSLLDDAAPVINQGSQSIYLRAQLAAGAARAARLANARAAALDAAARVVASGRHSAALGVLDLADAYLAWLLAPEDGGQPEVEGGNGPC